MSNLLVSPKWNSFINKVDAGEEISGGDLGNANIATRQLAENVMFLRDSMFTLVADATDDLSQAIVESNKKTKDEFDIIAGLIEAQNGIIIAEAQAREEAISASNTKIAEEAAARIEELGLQSVALQEEIDARKEAFRLEHISRAESEAAFTESLAEVLSEAEASVTKVENLSTQLIGGYDGSNLDFVTEGLLFQQKTVTSTAIQGMAEQISMLSAGVGEQFDTAEIWHFDKDSEDWINGVFDVGYLTVKSETVTSPTFLIDGDVYHHVKMRINKVGDPDWAGNLVWNSGSITLPEPVFVDDVTVVTLDTTWSGDITQLQLKLSTDADDNNYYKIDWITIGRPSPGASTASVLDLKIATATRDEALAQDIRGLSTKMDTDNALLSSDINTKLETITTQQQTQATDITTLSSNVDTMNANLSADIVEVNTTLVTKETALAEAITALTSKTNESETAVLSQLQTLTDTDSALGTQLNALSASFDTAAAEITAQNLVFTAEDLAQANQISQLVTKVDGNIAEVNTQIETLTNAESANANKFTSITAEFQALNDKTDASDAEIRVNAADITEERNARATDILAQATRIDVLTTEVGDNAASATSRINLLSLEDQALAERLDVLSAATDNTNADINLRLTALADEDTAFSEQLTQVMAAVDDNDAAVHDRVTALTTATDAEAVKLSALTAEVGANSAEILTTSRTAATNSGAIAEFNTRLTVEYLPKVENIESNILNAVKQTDVQYYLSISESQPVGGEWLTTAPTWEPSKYMFQRMDTTYVDGTIKHTPGINGTNISGAKGDKGLDGKDGSDGVAGIQGPSGTDGIQGPKGADGESSYTHVAYATSNTGIGFSTGYFETATYIGMYVDNIKEDSENYALYNWSLIKGADGTNGIPGPKGTDGKTSYLHIAYANSPDGGEGFSTTASIGKTYIGQYTDFELEDSTNYALYSWTLIKGEKGDQGPIGLTGLEGPKGDKGIQGPMGPIGPAGPEGLRGLTGLEGLQGDQGIPGEKGDDGLSSYTHIAYATSVTGTNFNTGHFSAATYIGMYVDNDKTDSTDTTKYKWSLIKGADGANGIAGPKGTDGKTSYLHIAYANNVTGNIGFSTTISEGKTHIGQYTDFELEDSEEYIKYNWTLIKGDKGDTGPMGLPGVPGIEGKAGANGIQGPKGADGTSSYTHLAYATSVTGTNFNTAWYPTATYIGMYIDRTEEDSEVPSDYNWSLIKGADGANGIAGPKGTDGKTTYLHIAYANSEAGDVGFSTTVSTGKTYIGQYTDTTLGDSEDYSIYSWSLIKGADGLSSYAHLAYATSATGTNFNTDHFQGATYIGMYVDNEEDDSTDYTKYNWSLIKGADGANGIPGPTGADGKTSYLHVAYATSATGAVGFSKDVSEGKTYIGQYTDFELEDSPTYTKYKWTLIKGEKGDQGIQGPIGLTGVRGLEGPKGETGITGAIGAVGQGVDTITSEYAVSTSKVTAPTVWSTTAPTWTSGKYIWTRSKIVYKNPVATSYTVASVDSSWEAVNEIQVGGRNLLLGTSDLEVGADYEFYAYKNLEPIFKEHGLVEYTLSVDLRTPVPGPINIYSQNGNGTRHSIGVKPCDVTTEWTRFTHTFTPSAPDLNHTLAMVSFYGIYSTGRFIKLRRFKIEKGNVATDWTPAPEDVDKSIITATDNAVQSTEIEYYLSTSATSPVGGIWLTTAPEWQQSKYMFSRTKIALSTGIIYKPSVNGTNISGARGNTGIQGPAGANGQPTFTWILYADDMDGSGMTPDPTDKLYIGIAFNKTSMYPPLDVNATAFNWSIINGGVGTPAASNPCLYVDGGYVKLPNEAKAVISGTSEASIELWIKKEDLGYGFIQLSDFADNNGSLYPYGTKDLVYIDTLLARRVSFNVKDVREWHHIAITRSSALLNNWKMYQNGELMYTTTEAGAMDVAYLDFEIGRNSLTRYARAYFRDVRLWSKSLTQFEIQKNMNRVLNGNESGLVGYWKFNDLTGTVVKDSTANAFHGTIINPHTTAWVDVVKYTWVKYGTSITGAGLSDDPLDKAYIGIAYNRPNSIESLDPADYTWSLIKGADGTSSYTHLAYATSSTGALFSKDWFAAATYIGMYVDNTETDSTDTTKYNWSLIKGADGNQGIPGPKGADGLKAYLHIAYATSATGDTGFSTSISAGKTYIGQYTDNELTDSQTYTKYNWTLIKGDKGDQGIQGIQGPIGLTGVRGLEGPKGDQGIQGADAYTNMVRTQDIWTLGTIGSQGKFSMNGPADANEIVTDIGPSLAPEILWKSTGHHTGGAGGWNYAGIPIDVTKSYRFSVWVKNLPGSSHTTYLGCGSCLNLNDSVDGNPYFWSGSLPSDDKWYVIIGVLHGADKVDGISSDIAGVYDPITGKRLINGYEFKHNINVSVQTHRAYRYYAQNAVGCFFTRPRMEEINGEELNLGALFGRVPVDGKSSYTHLAYATGPTGQGIQTDWFAAATYIGMYVDNTETDSSSPSAYNWSLIKGADGTQGIPGPKGADGLKAYLHIAYATSADGSIGFSRDVSAGKTYIGQYTDNELVDSQTYTRYKWTLIKGETGATGATGNTGATGAVGQGVDTITEQYAVSTSKTVAPTTWTTTMPVWSYGLYVWTRSMIKYKNPVATEYTQPLVDSSWEAVNNLEVGGRNFIPNSKLNLTSPDYNLLLVNLPNDLSVGETVTLTIEGSLSINKERFLIYDITGATELTTVPASRVNNKYIYTFPWKQGNSNTNTLGIWQHPAGIAGISTIESIKLERGNIATDWTPAPEDIDLAIQGSLDIGNSITNQFGQLKAETKVLTEIGGKISGWKNLNNGNTSSFDILADNFSVGNSGVMKKPFSIVGNDITFNGKVSFNSMTDTTVIDKAINDINNLEIGGRNLFAIKNVGVFYGSRNQPIAPSMIIEGTKISAPTSFDGLIGNVIPVNGDNIIVSGYTNLVGDIRCYYAYNNSGQPTFMVPVVNGRFEFKMPVSAGADTLYIGLGQYPWTSSHYIKDVKVEQGTKATRWTPAPEDVQYEITKAESNATTAAGNLATAAKDAAIDWSKVKDTRNANSDPNWYRTNYNRDTAREFKTLSVIGISAGGTYCYVETIVKYGDSSGGAVTQTAYTDDNRMFTRVGTTTTWTAWVESESSAGAQQKATAALDAAKIDAEARAKVAREAAAAAQTTANNATLLINDIGADNKLTAVEKQALVITWTDIQKNNDDIIARALSYGVSSTNYAAAYTALSNYITPILSSMTTTTTIVRSTFNGHFNLLFTRRSALDLEIANKANLNDKIVVIDDVTKKFITPATFAASAALTGFLIIETPITGNRMVKLNIAGYNYAGNSSNIDLSVGFYIEGTSFYSYDYSDMSTFPIGNVRLGIRNNAAVIIIGNSNTVWSYPKLEVVQAIVGNSASPDSWKDGWTIRVTPNLIGITNSILMDNINSISLKGLQSNIYYPDTTTINGGVIRTNSIGADKIVANSITANQIAGNTITANQIAGNTITGDKLKVNAITAREILGGSITADKINVTNLSAINSNLGTITGGSLNINNKFKVDALGNMTASSGTFSGTVSGGDININNKFKVSATGEVNISSATTGSRLVVTNELISVYDSAGILRVRLGIW